MSQDPKSQEEELDGSDKIPSLQDCLKVPGNAIQMPVPLLLHLFLSAYLVLLQAYCRTAYCRKKRSCG